MMLKKILKIEELDERELVDIEVSGNHLFYANDILTHNSSSDVDLTDTSESFGLPATADLMFALISTEELEQLGQIMVKQLKNRYNDGNVNKRFVVGIDRAKMRLYDCEQTAQDDMIDNMGSSEYDEDEEKPSLKNKFGGFKF
jgi:predicted nuclease of predicted toxin-antitoxin system